MIQVINNNFGIEQTLNEQIVSSCYYVSFKTQFTTHDSGY